MSLLVYFPVKVLSLFLPSPLFKIRKPAALPGPITPSFLEPEPCIPRQLFQFPKFIVNEKGITGCNPWQEPQLQGTPRPADTGAANFIWLFSFLLPPALLLSPSFYQRGLAALEGAKKELEGLELLTASDKVWEDRGPRPEACSSSIPFSLSVSRSLVQC